jgi:hypothetical protein
MRQNAPGGSLAGVAPLPALASKLTARQFRGLPRSGIDGEPAGIRGVMPIAGRQQQPQRRG